MQVKNIKMCLLTQFRSFNRNILAVCKIADLKMLQSHEYKIELYNTSHIIVYTRAVANNCGIKAKDKWGLFQ